MRASYPYLHSRADRNRAIWQDKINAEPLRAAFVLKNMCVAAVRVVQPVERLVGCYRRQFGQFVSQSVRDALEANQRSIKKVTSGGG